MHIPEICSHVHQIDQWAMWVTAFLGFVLGYLFRWSIS